jgi:hypothetical protein
VVMVAILTLRLQVCSAFGSTSAGAALGGGGGTAFCGIKPTTVMTQPRRGRDQFAGVAQRQAGCGKLRRTFGTPLMVRAEEALLASHARQLGVGGVQRGGGGGGYGGNGDSWLCGGGRRGLLRLFLRVLSRGAPANFSYSTSGD